MVLNDLLKTVRGVENGVALLSPTLQAAEGSQPLSLPASQPAPLPMVLD